MKVSIIIPVFNNLFYTKQCIDYIFKHTNQKIFEIIVVDNGSTDGTDQFLKDNSSKIKFILNKKNLGFARACNIGAKFASSNFLIFLNNDTIPLKNWLPPLIETLELNDKIGICGAKLLYPDDTIQHAGIVWKNDFPEHIYRGKPRDFKYANEIREYDMVTGACFAIKKNLFFELNGFDEQYVNGCEDIDLCLKVRRKGLKVIYNPLSELYHYEGQTEGRFNNVNKNLSLFRKRWKINFNNDGKFQFRLRNIPVYIYGECNIFSSLGIINKELLEQFSKKGLTVKNVSSIDEIDSNNGIVITHSWPPNFKISKLKNFKKFIILPWEYELIPKDWVAPLNEIFDEIWVPSSFVKKSLIASGVKNKKIFVIPNGFNPRIFNPIPLSTNPLLLTEKNTKFLYVGGTIWRKGIDILLDTYTKLFRKNDDVSLIIKDFGTNSFYKNQNYKNRIFEIIAQKDSPEIIYIEKNLSPYEIAELYRNSTCLVHPYRGEGFGMPVLESLACGTPVAVTKGGATDDFCNEDNCFFIDSFKIKFNFKGLNLVKDKINMNIPKENSLANILFSIYKNKNLIEKKKYKTFESVYPCYTWDNISEIYIGRLLKKL